MQKYRYVRILNEIKLHNSFRSKRNNTLVKNEKCLTRSSDTSIELIFILFKINATFAKKFILHKEIYIQGNRNTYGKLCINIIYC